MRIALRTRTAKSDLGEEKGVDGSEVIMKQLLEINFPELRINSSLEIKRAEKVTGWFNKTYKTK